MCEHGTVKRFLPWLLLGVLAWVSVLGLALGLAGTEKTQTLPPAPSTDSPPSLGVGFVPSWIPPDVGVSGSEVVCGQGGSGGSAQIEEQQQTYSKANSKANSKAYSTMPQGSAGNPSGAYIAFSVLSCSAVAPPVPAGSLAVQVNGHTVMLVQTNGLIVASWREDGTKLLLNAMGVPKGEVVRFIKGLRPAS
jgi:hypothetical protein